MLCQDKLMRLSGFLPDLTMNCSIANRSLTTPLSLEWWSNEKRKRKSTNSDLRCGKIKYCDGKISFKYRNDVVNQQNWTFLQSNSSDQEIKSRKYFANVVNVPTQIMQYKIEISNFNNETNCL